MINLSRVLASLLFTAITFPIAADHMNISDWALTRIVDNIPEPNACDREAAHPTDPLRTVRDGTAFDKINAQHAIDACKPLAQEMLIKYRENRPITMDQKRDLRAVYQLARATSKLGDGREALRINRSALELGYPYSYFYEYAAYKNGWGTARNPKRAAARLSDAIDARVPIAYLRRAEKEIERDDPNITQVITDLGRADKANLPVALTWGTLHEKMGEMTLIANASCVAGHCNKEIRTMSEYELLFTYNYYGLRSYYGALESALNFYHDYMRSHPTSKTASENITRIEDRLDMLNPMIKSKLDDLYRPHPK
jgi:hypothetical protein